MASPPLSFEQWLVCLVLLGEPCRAGGKHLRYARRTQSLRGHGSALLSEEAWRKLAERLNLSPAELDVLQGVLDDLSDKAIAGRMKIAPGTVGTHSKRLHSKLRVSTRAGLVVRILAEVVATPHLLYRELGTAKPAADDCHKLRGRLP